MLGMCRSAYDNLVAGGRFVVRQSRAASGMVDVDAVDAGLAEDVRAGLQARRAAIVAGTLSPFAAPLVDNAGTTRLARGTLADADIKSMDWFVAGVVGSVPKSR